MQTRFFLNIMSTAGKQEGISILIICHMSFTHPFYSLDMHMSIQVSVWSAVTIEKYYSFSLVACSTNWDSIIGIMKVHLLCFLIKWSPNVSIKVITQYCNQVSLIFVPHDIEHIHVNDTAYARCVHQDAFIHVPWYLMMFILQHFLAESVGHVGMKITVVSIWGRGSRQSHIV